MRNIKLEIAYDGSDYHGFQRQKEERTVQGVLEEVLSKLCAEKITLAGSGRTDAGVHALTQTVSFKTSGSIPTENIVRASAALLPADMAVLSACEKDADFHARFSAKWKCYGYRIICNERDNPFFVRYAWQLRERPSAELMNRAASLLVGTHDFADFRSSGSVTGNSVRSIYHACWEDKSDELYFRIAGDGFLYHMVRNIVWTLVQIGSGKYSIEEFAARLELPQGSFSGAPAPACGLYLERVFYEPFTEEAFDSFLSKKQSRYTSGI